MYVRLVERPVCGFTGFYIYLMNSTKICRLAGHHSSGEKHQELKDQQPNPNL